MKTLPNGIVVFNGTPHDICFWHFSWSQTVNVSCDAIINADMVESTVESRENVEYVQVHFRPTVEGQSIVQQALAAGADVIIGSTIAAQAYAGQVVAMVPAPGYERVPTSKKRMNPFRFLTYS